MDENYDDCNYVATYKVHDMEMVDGKNKVAIDDDANANKV